MSNDFLQQSMFSTQQIANGDHITGLVGFLGILFLIALSVIAFKAFQWGVKNGEKLANEKLQEHVLRSQIMRELNMSAPAKQGNDAVGAKPAVAVASPAADVAVAQPLPTLPPLPVPPVVAEVEEVAEPSNDEPHVSDDELVDELESSLAAK